MIEGVQFIADKLCTRVSIARTKMTSNYMRQDVASLCDCTVVVIAVLAITRLQLPPADGVASAGPWQERCGRARHHFQPTGCGPHGALPFIYRSHGYNAGQQSSKHPCDFSARPLSDVRGCDFTCQRLHRSCSNTRAACARPRTAPYSLIERGGCSVTV